MHTINDILKISKIALGSNTDDVVTVKNGVIRRRPISQFVQEVVTKEISRSSTFQSIINIGKGGSETKPAGKTGHVQFNKDGAFNGSDNLFWDSANNRLGIGTQTPTKALDVNGDAQAINLTATAKLTAASAQITSNAIIDGNLGIGVTTPLRKLHVKVDNYEILRLHRDHATNGAAIEAYNGSGKLGDFGFKTGRFVLRDPSAMDYFRADTNGRVWLKTAFTSGFAGAGTRWEDDGSETALTVDNLTVRKAMRVYELVINKIRATNGSLWVSDSQEVSDRTEKASDYQFRCFVDTDQGKSPVTFVAGDIVRAQTWDGRNIITVEGMVDYVHNDSAWSENRFNVRTDLNGNNWNGSQEELQGLTFVRIGNVNDTDRQGALYLTSNDSNAPYLDVLDGVTTNSFANKTKVRLGKLTGISDSDFSSITGYGLYSENVYLKGAIVAQSGKIGGWTISSTKLYSGSVFGAGAGVEIDSTNKRFTAYRDTSNYTRMHYVSSSDWGLKGVTSGNTVFQLGNTNKIGGWSFDSNKFSSSNGGIELDGTNNKIKMSSINLSSVDNDAVAGLHIKATTTASSTSAFSTVSGVYVDTSNTSGATQQVPTYDIIGRNVSLFRGLAIAPVTSNTLTYHGTIHYPAYDNASFIITTNRNDGAVYGRFIRIINNRPGIRTITCKSSVTGGTTEAKINKGGTMVSSLQLKNNRYVDLVMVSNLTKEWMVVASGELVVSDL